ncbi:MAG: DNA primase [Desulforudis sp.]|jgi:DNA primase|nr:MAG: DNA primase [Desulforudis sp.]
MLRVIVVNGRIPEELVEDVQARADIVEVISDYVRLEHKGRNYIGLCPFHQEKTPSFTVTPERQMFYCFGCSVGGNVLKFIMLKENLSFPESVRYLADRVGVHIPDTESHTDDRLDSSFEINALARDFFRQALAEDGAARTARSYLEKRGIPPVVQDQFQIGFAPSGWDALWGFLRRKGLSDGELVRVGLAVKSERGGVYDRFRNRIIFPVWDLRGRVVGFGGRVLDDSLPKYLNSPETPVFQKGKYLYGLHLAKQAIREEGRAVIVEGYLDTIAAHQYGARNVVAALGTSLTRDQGRLLMRYSMDIMVAFDADPAGIKATIRSLDILQDLGCRVGVVSVPDGQDPDDFLRQEGVEAWRRLVAGATPLFEYKLQRVLVEMPSDAPQDRLNIVQQVLPNIRAMNSEIDRELSIIKVSSILGLNPQTVKAEIGRLGAGAAEKWPNSDKIAKKLHNIVTNKPHARQQAELGLLRLVIENPDYVDDVRRELGEKFFLNRGCQHIFETFLYRIGNGECQAAVLANDLSDDDQRLLGSILASERPEGDAAVLLRDYIRTIKRTDKRQQKQDLLADLGAAERAGDLERASELMLAINNLTKTP